MKRLDDRDAFVARVRTIQATHPAAHSAATNWGNWAADRRGIFPSQKGPGIWNWFKRDENDSYGEEVDTPVLEAPVKAEGPERPPYDELQGLRLDERIHGHGGLNEESRFVLRAAYVWVLPDYQLPKAAGCRNEDQFCELLESSLKFIRRFV